jgi:hypothetical protein
MMHDLPGNGFMYAVSKLLGRTLGLAALGSVVLSVILAAPAVAADPSAASRLIFDPGALDRSQLGSDRDPAPPTGANPADKSHPQTSEQIWIPNTFNLPDLGDRSPLGRGLAHGLSSSHDEVAPADTNLFEQRVTPGGLSIGLETETIIKQRSLSGDADKDPERDTILDPKRQRGFLPFIGLSAKSSLQ